MAARPPISATRCWYRVLSGCSEKREAVGGWRLAVSEERLIVRLNPVVGAVVAGVFLVTGAAQAAEDAALAHARKLLQTAILVDGHNDLPWAIREDKAAPGDVKAYDLRKTTPGDTDLARLKAGGLGAQFWSVYVPGELQSGFARTQLEQIDIARQIIAQYPDRLQFATSV